MEHLSSTDGRLQLAQAVVVSVALEGHSDVRADPAVVAQEPQALSKAAVRGGDHAALARRNDLARVETEARCARPRAAPAALTVRSESACGVFDQKEPVRARHVLCPTEIRWL